MAEYEHELHMLWAVAINALVLFAAYRTARALGDGDGVQMSADVLLFWWLAQYIVVGALGLSGLLTPMWMSFLAAIFSAIAIWITRKRPREIAPLPRRDAIAFRAAAGFVTAFTAAVVWGFRSLPAMADDPLTYHLPAAAVWLQQGRITIFETWFFNPANTYSPLAGSMFAASLIAPFGNDTAARFMQAPAVQAIFFACVLIARRIGAGFLTATSIAVAVALSRPIVGQAGLAKDDLFLAAFALMAVAEIARGREFSFWRFGVAVGLAVSVKYTAVYTLVPMCLLAIALRMPMKRVLLAACVAFVIAGPWFVRNWVMFGNPLFPVEIRAFGVQVFGGLFVTEHSERLRSWDELKEVFITGYFGVGYWLAITAVILYAGGITFGVKKLKSAIGRVMLLGPVLGIGLFILTSPYREVRFVYVWICIAILCASFWPARVATCASIAAMVISISTSFQIDWVLDFVWPAAIGAMLVIACGMNFARSRRVRIGAALITAAILGGLVFVYWKSYVEALAETSHQSWLGKYGVIADAWNHVRTKLPPDETIAYTNSYLTYPLMGARLDRRVVHLPVSRTVTSLDKIPRIAKPVSARSMMREVLSATQRDADKALWIERLRAAKIRYILIVSHGPHGFTPIEARWVRGDRQFRRVFSNDSAAIYELFDSVEAL